MKRGINGYYHLLYKTTNLINEHFYVGIHSTRILEDGYLGSGKRLKAEVKKYGKENFRREILEYCDNRISLACREKEIVNKEFRNNESCLNLTNGGDGDFTACNASEKTKKARKETGRKVLQKAWKDPEYIEKRKKICSTHLRKLHEEGRIKYGSFRGQSHSRETKEKIGKTVSSLQQGEQNSQFGTCWIYHELIGSRKCKKELLPEYLEQGWYKGRNLKILCECVVIGRQAGMRVQCRKA